MGIRTIDIAAILGETSTRLAATAARIALAAAAIAALYLLVGIFGGGLAGVAALDTAAQLRVSANLSAAGQVVGLGTALGVVLLTLLFLGDASVGIGLLALGLALTVGVPYAASLTQANPMPAAIALAIKPFAGAGVLPLVLGLAQVGWSLVGQIAGAFGAAAPVDDAHFGGGAVREARPLRLSPLGKCWEGGFCRSHIRERCTIYTERAACWKRRSGCYCEEEAISKAARRVSGILLEMAPSSERNFSTTPTATPRRALTAAQKAERCRHCVIYNDHQRDKYRVLLPTTILATIGLCAALSGPMRLLVGGALHRTDVLVARFSFLPSGSGDGLLPLGAAELPLTIGVAAILVAKAIQMLEWAIFVKKI
jgi:hypothetical protein